MTAGLFTSPSLRLEWFEAEGRDEVLDAQSGARLAALIEVARVRSPRGMLFKPDAVKTPRLTYALSGSDGAPLLYVDRAEHLKLYPLPPETALIRPDGTVLCRVDYEHNSPMNGGGRVQPDETGKDFVPAVRLVDAENRPLADVLMEVTPWDNEKPQLANGQDARLARWVGTEGAILAERRDGVLYFAERLPDAWRAMVLGSFLSMMLEYNLPFGKEKASDSVPDVFPGYARVHSAYDEFQRIRVGLWKKPVEGVGREAPVLRAGVRTYQLEYTARIAAPFCVVAVIVNLILRFT